METDSRLTEIPARLALVTGRLNRRMRIAGGGLSHGLLSALSTIDQQGPLRLAELAHCESVSAPSATRLVSELEAKGLVSRETDPADGRAILITTTSTGSKAVVDEKSARAAVITELLGRLEPHEVATVASALAALESAMNNGSQTGAHPIG